VPTHNLHAGVAEEVESRAGRSALHPGDYLFHLVADEVLLIVKEEPRSNVSFAE
jgi:hypothetical protein